MSSPIYFLRSVNLLLSTQHTIFRLIHFSCPGETHPTINGIISTVILGGPVEIISKVNHHSSKHSQQANESGLGFGRGHLPKSQRRWRRGGEGTRTKSGLHRELTGSSTRRTFSVLFLRGGGTMRKLVRVWRLIEKWGEAIEEIGFGMVVENVGKGLEARSR